MFYCARLFSRWDAMSHRAHSSTAAVRFAVPHFAAKRESQTLAIMNKSNFRELYGSNVTRSLLFSFKRLENVTLSGSRT